MANYFVDTAVGNDGNAGTSAGSGNAWATIAHALSTATSSGDHVNVKASGTYTISTGLSAATNAFGGRIRFEGYTSSPGDHGQVTVQTSAAVVGITFAGYGYTFENFTFDGNTTGTIGVSVTGTYGNDLINCIVKRWTAEGVKVAGGIFFSMNGGEVTSCVGTNGAIDINVLPGSIVGVKVHGNTGVGLYCSAPALILNCQVYSNGSHGIDYNAYPVSVNGCTIDNNSGDGLKLDNQHSILSIANNIFTRNTGKGINSINLSGSGIVDPTIDYNWFGTGGLANGSDRSTNLAASPHDLTGDPQYVSAGSDYTPQNAAVQAGYP